ncbi:hypothetical protein ACLF3G_05610 [Falsiroseomonas sp. HC035]|uniref:hypothetical protein n=1 Tax=Falsiroseomonas sp. HC035 TaxID=3390999 RepID=UPI003D31F9D3
MRTIVGTICIVQESRFRLLTAVGRGLHFVLAHNANLEPQDLPALAHRQVRVDYEPAPGLRAHIAHVLEATP